ncbi:hypothetical protein U1Q18_048753, partial [Sarracenia purpurea var. burkii]
STVQQYTTAAPRQSTKGSMTTGSGIEGAEWMSSLRERVAEVTAWRRQLSRAHCDGFSLSLILESKSGGIKIGDHCYRLL